MELLQGFLCGVWVQEVMPAFVLVFFSAIGMPQVSGMGSDVSGWL
jgi:hypothetical protein